MERTLECVLHYVVCYRSHREREFQMDKVITPGMQEKGGLEADVGFYNMATVEI